MLYPPAMMTRRPRRDLSLAIGFGILTLAFAGSCSSALDDTRLEAEIASGFQTQTGIAVSGVDCPAGVPLQMGAESQCTLTTQEGETVTIDVTQQDGQGNVRWMVRG
ncbi:hypothetical protein BH18CHL1_BH18CHL1_03120 [soil metagenome]